MIFIKLFVYCLLKKRAADFTVSTITVNKQEKPARSLRDSQYALELEYFDWSACGWSMI